MQDEKELTAEEVNKAFELWSNAKPPTHYTYFALSEEEGRIIRELFGESVEIKIIRRN
jgi:hypothetical protein